MWSLKIISDEYGISFDELLKEDEKYIKSVDNTKKKMSILKRILIVSLVILITLVVGFFVALYMAFQPTPDGERKMRVSEYLQNPYNNRRLCDRCDTRHNTFLL